MSENTELPWFAVVTAPAAERRVTEAFRDDYGCEVFRPTRRIWRILGARRRPYDQTLIHQYAIVRLRPDQMGLFHDVDGAIRVLSTKDGTPKQVCPQWVAEIQAMFEAGDFDETLPRDAKGRIKLKLVAGDPIKVVAGPFIGYSGKVVRIEKKKAKAVVDIENARGYKYTGDIELVRLEAA